ncbi:MAG: 2-oxoglutarate dehydrogenase complex dihydrolipoyllysine-residue succinyltransferase [Candidatus Sumerlaeia bacterium]|nr:2-oxoglutarate dehydrogenase complex dihydrolipoyllysine-residue succinyltransferase [Candidatus Sumerlaeia bacterium]
MKVDIVVPSVGESITEGVLGRWLVADGGYVKKGESLFELETDKTNTEVPAAESGVVAHSVAEGETVRVNSIVGHLDTSAAAPANGSGASAAQAEPAAVGAAADSGKSAKASPVAKKMMQELGVDPAAVKAGDGVRIKGNDVLAAAKPAPAPAPAPAAKAAPPAPATPQAYGADRSTRRERVTQLRKTIAARLVEAQHNAAMLTTFNEADMSRVMAMRKAYKESFEKRHGVGLGFMSFFVKACVQALQEIPRANAQLQGDEIVYHNYVDCGVAVGTDRGLVVPVLRDSDKLSFAQVEQGIGALAKRARDGSLQLSDLQGGTFTITNGGVYGSLLSTPILNPPQTAILGMHKIQERPVVDPATKQIVARPMMYLALSYDHRLLDGKEAVTFLVRVKECLEDPERLLLQI